MHSKIVTHLLGHYFANDDVVVVVVFVDVVVAVVVVVDVVVFVDVVVGIDVVVGVNVVNNVVGVTCDLAGIIAVGVSM